MEYSLSGGNAAAPLDFIKRKLSHTSKFSDGTSGMTPAHLQEWTAKGPGKAQA